MSPQLLPRPKYIVGQNILLFFSFLFGKESEVYEQVNALKIPLISLSQPVHAATDLNLDLQSIPWATTWSNLAFDLYRSFEVIEPYQIICLIQSILRTLTSLKTGKSCVSDLKLWLYMCAADHPMLSTTSSVKFPAVISIYQSTGIVS